MAPAPKNPPKPFSMVRRSVWRSKRFSSLPNDDARYLFLYYLTSPHQTHTGCFVLDDGYALADLTKTGTDWTLAKYQATKTALIASGLIMEDQATVEILVTQWWKDNGPNNDSWFVGATKQCEAIESVMLREAAQAALADCWEAFQMARGLSPALGPMPPGTTAAGMGRLAALNKRGARPA